MRDQREHTQRVLPAYESVTINNTMTVRIAALAAVFLDESPSPRQWLAIVLVTAATIAVHLTGARRRA